MSNEDKKFEKYVESIRFDDTPSTAHREKLERQLLEAWDHEQKYGDYVEPVSLYLRKLAIAASFLVICGVLFWGIDKAFIGEQSYVARHPDRQAIEQIIDEENVSGVEKKQLVAQIKDIWAMIGDEDSDSLVAVLETDEIAYTVRTWAAKYLGKFGGEETLDVLETTIEHLDVTDPNNPLSVAAAKIRKRLGLPEPTKIEPADTEQPKTNSTLEAAPSRECRPDFD